MTKPIVIALLLALVCAVSLRASAQGTTAETYGATKAECEQKAEAENFGIHYSERHRFVVRCIAGLSQR